MVRHAVDVTLQIDLADGTRHSVCAYVRDIEERPDGLTIGVTHYRGIRFHVKMMNLRGQIKGKALNQWRPCDVSGKYVKLLFEPWGLSFRFALEQEAGTEYAYGPAPEVEYAY
jgi:hypothetical protein